MGETHKKIDHDFAGAGILQLQRIACAKKHDSLHAPATGACKRAISQSPRELAPGEEDYTKTTRHRRRALTPRHINRTTTAGLHLKL